MAMSEVKQPPPLPDRLATDPHSPHHIAEVFEHDIGIRLNDKERFDVDEYCISEGWVKVPAGKTFPVPFKLTGSDIMHSQTSLAGKVKLEARVDKDKDAMTKNPGDVVGEGKELVSIPANDVVVTLDRIL